MYLHTNRDFQLFTDTANMAKKNESYQMCNDSTAGFFGD